MLNLVKELPYQIKKQNKKINLNDIKEGINSFDEFIVTVLNKDITVYDRNCDHKGGKIITKDGDHICPIHNWKFDPLKVFIKMDLRKKKENLLLKEKILLSMYLKKYPA